MLFSVADRLTIVRGMKSRLVILAFAAVSTLAVVAVAYGYRTRDIAIRGWAAAEMANEEAEAAREAALQVAKSAEERLEDEKRKAADAKVQYRAAWMLVVGSAPKNDLDFAIAVSDYLHRGVPLGPKDTEGTWDERLTNAVVHGTEQAYCGTYSTFLRMILERSGIPARTVQLAAQDFVGGNPMGATHVTVEVRIQDTWIIVDPTFDATFSCGENPDLIGIAEARQCTDLVANQHPGTLAGRNVAEHPTSWSELLAYSMATSSQIGERVIDVEAFPSRDWLVRARKLHAEPRD